MSRPWLRHGARCVPVPVVRQKGRGGSHLAPCCSGDSANKDRPRLAARADRLERLALLTRGLKSGHRSSCSAGTGATSSSPGIPAPTVRRDRAACAETRGIVQQGLWRGISCVWVVALLRGSVKARGIGSCAPSPLRGAPGWGFCGVSTHISSSVLRMQNPHPRSLPSRGREAVARALCRGGSLTRHGFPVDLTLSLSKSEGVAEWCHDLVVRQAHHEV